MVFPSLTRDRSKWAVTEKLGRWICVGDLDRVVGKPFPYTRLNLNLPFLDSDLNLT